MFLYKHTYIACFIRLIRKTSRTAPRHSYYRCVQHARRCTLTAASTPIFHPHTNNKQRGRKKKKLGLWFLLLSIYIYTSDFWKPPPPPTLRACRATLYSLPPFFFFFLFFIFCSVSLSPSVAADTPILPFYFVSSTLSCQLTSFWNRYTIQRSETSYETESLQGAENPATLCTSIAWNSDTAHFHPAVPYTYIVCIYTYACTIGGRIRRKMLKIAHSFSPEEISGSFSSPPPPP